MNRWLPFAALATVVSLSAPPAAALGPLFFEDILIKGDEADWSENGAADIANVYVSELVDYDPEADAQVNLIMVRVEATVMSDVKTCTVVVPGPFPVTVQACNVQYDLYFKDADKAHHFNATFGWAGPKCCDTKASNVRVGYDSDSVRFLIDRDAYELLPGSQISQIYVTSSLVAGPNVQPADRAPGDNGNMPYDQVPELEGLYAEPYTLEGVYPFFEVKALTPLTLDSVRGEPVKFEFEFVPTPGVKEDNLRVRWDVPEGWSVTPNRGSTGPEPIGLMTSVEEGIPAPFAFTASPNVIVEEGEVVALPMRVYSGTNGYAYVPTAVRITGDAIEDPDFVVTLLDSGPFRTGTPTTIRFEALDAAGDPLVDVPIEVVFSLNARKMATVPAEYGPDGYLVRFEFPEPGTWTIDVRLAKSRPAPHASFGVDVGDGAGASGFEALALVGAVGLLVLRRRLAA